MLESYLLIVLNLLTSQSIFVPYFLYYEKQWTIFSIKFFIYDSTDLCHSNLSQLFSKRQLYFAVLFFFFFCLWKSYSMFSHPSPWLVFFYFVSQDKKDLNKYHPEISQFLWNAVIFLVALCKNDICEIQWNLLESSNTED